MDTTEGIQISVSAGFVGFAYRKRNFFCSNRIIGNTKDWDCKWGKVAREINNLYGLRNSIYASGMDRNTSEYIKGTYGHECCGYGCFMFTL